ncbi:endonuclease/exonuclease/phosphatase family protein, partial [Corynebacterium bovis]
MATYNASLNRAHEGDLVRDLSTPDNPQARAVATVMRAQAPDILVVNEFDHDPEGRALDLFRRNYLENPDLPGDPVTYPYAVSAPVNTGVDSGLDL